MGEDLKLELYYQAPSGELIKYECKDVVKTIDLKLLIEFKKFEIDNILKKSFIAMADNFWRKASKRHPLKAKGIQAVLKLGRI